VAEQYQKPYLDSNVFIAWITGEADRHAVADHILNLAERGVFKIYTSALTLAEVHKLRTGAALSARDDGEILAYFEHDFIQLVDVDRGIGEQANRFCRQYGIYPNDAIHLACALRAGCDVLLAWDNRFAKVQHPDIRIEEPCMIGQAQLPGLAPPT
jgi:predicted nucleic acid-binding protein